MGIAGTGFSFARSAATARQRRQALFRSQPQTREELLHARITRFLLEPGRDSRAGENFFARGVKIWGGASPAPNRILRPENGPKLAIKPPSSNQT